MRRRNKDHLKEHAGVKLATQDILVLPDHQDPLKFWTMHPTENMLVDLTPYAVGESEASRSAHNWLGPFSGRPQLIHQVATAVEAAITGRAKFTVDQVYASIRSWWRLLDAVEAAASQQGQPMTRVEDVRQLMPIHRDYAYRSGMDRHKFQIFLRVANAVLRELDAPVLFWGRPEDKEPNRHLPSEEQIKVLRVALKQTWIKVRQHWTLLDRVRAEEFVPQTENETDLLKHCRYYVDRQLACGVALPTSEELRGEYESNNFNLKTGLAVNKLHATVFPTSWDVDSAFHMCLATTGWNPSVLYSLNCEDQFLRSHPKDKERYILVGKKVRANSIEQIVTGLWKTSWGPGPIIRAWMARTALLREQLKAQLVQERKLYVNMSQKGASPYVLSRQQSEIQRIEQGCRSVWLYVNSHGRIAWLGNTRKATHNLNDKSVPFLTSLIEQINRDRKENPISLVKPSDFRDIFALYAWRQTGGNILAVMRLLNHSHLRTTQCYVDNNITNAERDQEVRRFLDHLFSELGNGRLDFTILAHMQKYGAVSPEMHKRLEDFRALERSRLGTACRDPFRPPVFMQSQANGRCGPQRCLLCKEHAVILPESMHGIAMRVEELEAAQKVLPVEVWLGGDFPKELGNGLDVLRLFSPDDVRNSREHWAQAIASGDHRIPGLNLIAPQMEFT